MADFIVSLSAIFGGVFGSIIGFFFIAATAVLLALPYILLTRRDRGTDAREDDEMLSRRY